MARIAENLATGLARDADGTVRLDQRYQVGDDVAKDLFAKLGGAVLSGDGYMLPQANHRARGW